MAVSRRYIDQRGKTRRAFAAYLDLMDAGDWLREGMSQQLASFDLTMMQFRVLETLYHDGPQYQQALSRKFRCSKQNVAFVIKSLARRGWVRSKASRLGVTSAAGWVNPSGAASVKRPAQGRRIVLVELTPAGRRLIANVYPKHAKVVKAEMRALEGREQRTLSRLCRKLREGDVLRFYREMTHVDVDKEEGIREPTTDS